MLSMLVKMDSAVKVCQECVWMIVTVGFSSACDQLVSTNQVRTVLLVAIAQE